MLPTRVVARCASSSLRNKSGLPSLVDAASALQRAPRGVTCVSDLASARRVVGQLMQMADRHHACDTEVIDIDLDKQSPFGHGRVICVSIYSGPDVDFGTGPRLWIDTLSGQEGIMDELRPFLESEKHVKTWHNYSFDRHVLSNHGIDVRGFGGDTMHMARLLCAGSRLKGYSLEKLTNDFLNCKKKTMKERFGFKNTRKDGTEGKLISLPPIIDLQLLPEFREDFIDYSASDAELTWFLREKLEQELRANEWGEHDNMYSLYFKHWLPFGELLTDMERTGFYVRAHDYLPSIEKTALEDMGKLEDEFRVWACKVCPDARYMNVKSATQKQQLLFAPCKDAKGKVLLEEERMFKTENSQGHIEPGQKKANKYRPFIIKGIGIPYTRVAASGKPSADSAQLNKISGDPLADPPRYGILYDHMGGGLRGQEACVAVNALVRAGAIEKLLNGFIVPLQTMVDKNSRIHCSLNLNTDTGRLSSRCPNLQNQPALEKDIYKIRRAFAATEGNTLIVADYGQLELRLLAHMAKCESMIQAFKQGGDFHSRTAIGMYPEVKQAIDDGRVLLEWDWHKGEAPAPLLKDVFGAERRKAKTLNFSIAYGKTARGLATDWNVLMREAEETLERWFSDRPEVKVWQLETIQEARRTMRTRTLLGRFRTLPDITSRNIQHRRHAERAAINTPIQGGAADVVMCSMQLIHDDIRLRELGWKLVLQVHDEVILEGAKESVDEALDIVKRHMRFPFGEDNQLLVELVVDAKSADTWYDAK